LKILRRIFGFEEVRKCRKRDIEILCFKSDRKQKNPNQLSSAGVTHAIFEIALNIERLQTNQNWIIRFMWAIFGILLYSLK